MRIDGPVAGVEERGMSDKPPEDMNLRELRARQLDGQIPGLP